MKSKVTTEKPLNIAFFPSNWKELEAFKPFQNRDGEWFEFVQINEKLTTRKIEETK